MKVKLILIILIILAGFSFSVYAQEKIFSFDVIIYKDDRVELIDFQISDGKVTDFPKYDDANYFIRILSFEGEILFEGSMKITYIAHPFPPPGEEEREVELNETEKFLRMPYFANAKTIELYHDDKLIYSLDVAQYICDNDGTCDENESNQNCPSDCKQQEAQPESKDGGLNRMLIVGIVLIIVGIIVIYLIIRKNNARREQEIISRSKFRQ